MELKELVGEELAGKLSASTDETVKQTVAKLTTAKIMLGDPTTYVPKSEFNEKNEALKAHKELIKKHEADLESLKAQAAGSASLQEQIANLQAANKAAKAEYEAGQARSKKTLAVQLALVGAGVNDETARNLLSKQFEIDKLELDDKGEVKGIVDLLKPIKDNAAFKSMFGEVRMSGQQHNDGSNPDPVLGTLETQLIDAQKRGKMAEVVAIRNKIFELNNKGK